MRALLPGLALVPYLTLTAFAAPTPAAGPQARIATIEVSRESALYWRLGVTLTNPGSQPCHVTGYRFTERAWKLEVPADFTLAAGATMTRTVKAGQEPPGHFSASTRVEVLGSCAPAASRGATTVPGQSVDDVATRFVRAALQGDRAGALSLSLSPAEAGQLMRLDRSAARELFDKRDAIIGDLVKAGNHGVVLAGVKVLRTQVLRPRDGKVTREIEMVIVQPELMEAGGRKTGAGAPLIFLGTTHGWRFAPGP